MFGYYGFGRGWRAGFGRGFCRWFYDPYYPYSPESELQALKNYKAFLEEEIRAVDSYIKTLEEEIRNDPELGRR